MALSAFSILSRRQQLYNLKTAVEMLMFSYPELNWLKVRERADTG